MCCRGVGKGGVGDESCSGGLDCGDRVGVVIGRWLGYRSRGPVGRMVFDGKVDKDAACQEAFAAVAFGVISYAGGWVCGWWGRFRVVALAWVCWGAGCDWGSMVVCFGG